MPVMTSTPKAEDAYYVRLQPEVGEFGYERTRLDGSKFRSGVVRVYDDRAANDIIHVQIRSFGERGTNTTLRFDSLAGFGELLADLTEAAHAMAAKSESPSPTDDSGQSTDDEVDSSEDALPPL